MQQKYSIPLTLVSLTAVTAIGLSVLPSGNPTDQVSLEGSFTENSTLGYDFEYVFDVPRITGNIVIKLPDTANIEPVSLFSDEFGERTFFEASVRNERELVYKNLGAGNYHFVYTSEHKDALLTDVSVEEI